MKIFDYTTPIPKFIDGKSARVHEIVMMLLTFVIIPIASVLLIVLPCKALGINITETTISMLAWISDKLAEVYIWGLLNLGLFIYLFVLNLESQQYSKWVKIIFYILVSLSSLLLIIGVSVPFNEKFPNYQLLHKVHNVMIVTGFALNVIIWILFAITTYFRNIRQGLIISGLTVFFIITAATALPLVKHPDSIAKLSCVTQVYVFFMINVVLALNYCFAKILCPKKPKEKQD